MESEGSLQGVRGLAELAHLEVFAQEGLVVGMRAVLDDALGTLYGVGAAQVGDTLVGDDDVDGVLRRVGVGDHGHDIRDEAALRYRRAGENRDVAVAGEVTRTADAVHHLDAEDVAGVDGAEDVGLEGGVHGDDAETADNLGVVRDFGGTHDNLVVEEVHVGEQLLLGGVAEGHRAGRGKCALAFLHQLEHGVLDNLGVHHEVGKLLSLAQAVEDGVCHVAHAALQGQELLGDAAGAVFAEQEIDDVVADFGRGFVNGGEGLYAVKLFGVDDAHNLLGVDFEHGAADAVVGVVDGHLATVWGVVEEHHVVHAMEVFGQLVVDFDENLVGHVGVGGHVAQAAAQQHLAVGGDVGGLDDGEVDRAVEAVAGLLGHLRQVTVEVVDVVCVDVLTRYGEVLVRSATVDGVVLGQKCVDVAVCGGAGEDIDLVLAACLMFLDSFAGNTLGDTLGSTGSGEAAQAQGSTVADNLRCFIGSDVIERHF